MTFAQSNKHLPQSTVLKVLIQQDPYYGGLSEEDT